MAMRPRFLWLLIVVYVSTLLMANWYDARIIQFFHLQTDAGTLVFPVTFLCADIITEVYGYQKALLAIATAFVINIAFLTYGWIVTHMPTPSGPAVLVAHNQQFDNIMQANSLIILASFVCYLTSEPLNAYVVSRSKRWLKGKMIALRFLVSTIIAAFIDSVVFSFIGLSQQFDTAMQVFNIALTMWGIKVFIEVLGLPLSTFLAKKLKKIDSPEYWASQEKNH